MSVQLKKFDGGRSNKCPLCGVDRPDPKKRGACQACGYLLREVFYKRLHVVELTLAAGVVVAILGVAVAVGMGQRWPGAIVFLMGLGGLAYGAWGLSRCSATLMAALTKRSGPETVRLLGNLQKILIGLIAVFVGGCVFAVPYYFRVVVPQRHMTEVHNQLTVELPRFTRDLNISPGKIDRQVAGEARIVGRVLVVERDLTSEEWRVSPTHFLLPNELRAETPDEVGTVVWLEYEKVKAADYSGGYSGYRVDCHVTVIDLAQRVAVDRQKFDGAPLPTDAMAAKDIIGEPPTQIVIIHLTKLPRS